MSAASFSVASLTSSSSSSSSSSVSTSHSAPTLVLVSSADDVNGHTNGFSGSLQLTASSTEAEAEVDDERWSLLPEKRRRGLVTPGVMQLLSPRSPLTTLDGETTPARRLDSRLGLQVLVLVMACVLSDLVLQLLFNSRCPALAVDEHSACTATTAPAAPAASSLFQFVASAAAATVSPPSFSSPQPRVLLVMTDNRQLEDDVSSTLALAAYANWMYSRLHPGYSFLYVRQTFSRAQAAAAAPEAAEGKAAAMPETKKQPACYDGVLKHERAASWCKLQVLYRLMAADAGRHDVIFFLDSDAAVSYYELQLQDWLHLVRIQGCNATAFQTESSPCAALFFTNDFSRFMGIADAFHFPNAGVWLVRPSELGLQLVQRWWHQSLPEYNLHHPYEQIGLWQTLDELTAEQRAAFTGVILEPSMRDLSALQFVQHRSSWFAETRLPFFTGLQRRMQSDARFVAAGIDTDFSAAIAAIQQSAMTVMDLSRDEVPPVPNKPLDIKTGSNNERRRLKQPPRWTTRLPQIKKEQLKLEAHDGKPLRTEHGRDIEDEHGR